MMINKIFFVPMFLLLVISFSAGSAQAHSTAGRIKIDLDRKQPTTDDFAYFMESYVHRQLYESEFEKWHKRFYVKEFLRVDQQGDRATVHFLTLDFKEKRDFPDSMTFERNRDGVWYYQPEKGGEKIVVHTYVMKWGYYYQRYILPASVAGLALGLSALALLFIKRRKTGPQQSA